MSWAPDRAWPFIFTLGGSSCAFSIFFIEVSPFLASLPFAFHNKSACGDPSAFRRREETGVPFLVAWDGWPPLPLLLGTSFMTNQERNATQVRIRQSFTFAPCVKRLFVR